MTEASNIRKYLNLFEAAAPDYVGAKSNPMISYSADQTKGEITKVTAFLTSYKSGEYTKLGNDLKEIEALTERVKVLQAEVKENTRAMIGDLFHASDAVRTRVVETVSFVFHMSKDPVATSSVSYSKVLKELEQHLTPDLKDKLKTITEQFTSPAVQKAASLKATDKRVQAEEGINEGIGDKLTAFFAKMKTWADKWGARYDSKLNALKAELGMNESIIEDSSAAFNLNDEVKINAPNSSAHGEYGHITGIEDGVYKVTLEGTGFYGMYDANELVPAQR